MNDSNATVEDFDPQNASSSGETRTGWVEQSKSKEEELSGLHSEISRLREQLAQTEDRLHKAEADRDKRLEHTKNEHPLAVALLDGDGMIFDPKYLKKGEDGGKEAAAQLYQGLKGHLDKILDGVPPAPNLILFIFLAKYNLMRALTEDGQCERKGYFAFMKGLVQSHSLLNVVDVDAGKERADDRMRSHLGLFLRNFQTRIVFFGGCHDDGYAGLLQEAQTDGWGQKIVLLRGYSNEPIPEGIVKLQLPIVEIAGLFKPEKIPPFPQQPQTSTTQSSDVPPPLSSSNSTPVHSPRKKGLNALGFPIQAPPSRRKSRTIMLGFLLSGECPRKENCPFDHDAEPAPDELERMQHAALLVPCKYINKGKPCPKGEKCPHGHKCPQGPECAKGDCKFKGKGMHD